jgi:hypothetical protein
MRRREVESWLLAHAFRALPQKATGHRYFERNGVKVTLRSHGPQELSRKHQGMLIRQIVAAGIPKDEVLAGLR